MPESMLDVDRDRFQYHLFVQQVPMIGMLMIPKTIAYVAIGFLAYRDLYKMGSIQAQKVALETTI